LGRKNIDRIDDSNLSPNNVSYLKLISDHEYADTVYQKAITQNTFVLENEIFHLQGNREKIYNDEVISTMIDFLHNEPSNAKKILFLRNWMHFLSSSMNDTKDKVLTILEDTITLSHKMLGDLQKDKETKRQRDKETKRQRDIRGR
jgi:hypothetical protein